MERERLIAKHGGYRKLKSFQVAQLTEKFENDGGFSERLYRVRKQKRGY
jgi:hypothetical protein